MVHGTSRVCCAILHTYRMTGISANWSASFPRYLDGGVLVDDQQVALTVNRTLTLPDGVRLSSTFASAGERRMRPYDGARGWRVGEMGRHFVDQGG
jgi:hypothetical protein